MPRRPSSPPPAPHPDVAAGGIRRTRHYMHAFIAALKDCGEKPEHVRQVLRELLGADGVDLSTVDLARMANEELANADGVREDGNG